MNEAIHVGSKGDWGMVWGVNGDSWPPHRRPLVGVVHVACVGETLSSWLGCPCWWLVTRRAGGWGGGVALVVMDGDHGHDALVVSMYDVECRIPYMVAMMMFLES